MLLLLLAPYSWLVHIKFVKFLTKQENEKKVNCREETYLHVFSSKTAFN